MCHNIKCIYWSKMLKSHRFSPYLINFVKEFLNLSPFVLELIPSYRRLFLVYILNILLTLSEETKNIFKE